MPARRCPHCWVALYTVLQHHSLHSTVGACGPLEIRGASRASVDICLKRPWSVGPQCLKVYCTTSILQLNTAMGIGCGPQLFTRQGRLDHLSCQSETPPVGSMVSRQIRVFGYVQSLIRHPSTMSCLSIAQFRSRRLSPVRVDPNAIA